MDTSRTTRETLAVIGPLLAYPELGFDDSLRRAIGATTNRSASRALGEFRREAETIGIDGLRERYTGTFDLNPTCPPYLGVQLFGQDSAKRARLMAGLASNYLRGGFDRGTELPDHLSVVLRFAPRFDVDEWSDLAELCLAPALEKMESECEPTGGPYRHLLRAVRRLVVDDCVERTDE